MSSSPHEFDAINWRLRESGALRGFFSLVLPSGMIVHDCQLFEKGDRRWIGLPTKQYESGGERKFAALIEFSDRQTEDRFREQALRRPTSCGGES
jgi:hypothetical protein